MRSASSVLSLSLVSSAKSMAALLTGKVTAITGAVTGIGRAIALEYLKQGASVAVNYYPDAQSESQFKELSASAGEGAKLIAVAGDISKPETGAELVSKAVETWGRLDVFVSNAGVCKFNDFLRYVDVSIPGFLRVGTGPRHYHYHPCIRYGPNLFRIIAFPRTSLPRQSAPT